MSASVAQTFPVFDDVHRIDPCANAKVSDTLSSKEKDATIIAGESYLGAKRWDACAFTVVMQTDKCRAWLLSARDYERLADSKSDSFNICI